MSELTLHPGPRLEKKSWKPPEGANKGAWIPADVTLRAAEFLFTPVSLAPGVTLADLFQLLGQSPILQTVFRRSFVAELCAEAARGPVDTPRECAAHEKLEYLELYQAWGLDSSTQEIQGLGQYQLHGVGPLLSSDVLEDGTVLFKAGTRVEWGISLSPLRELLPLELRVRPLVPVCESDIDAKMHLQLLATYVAPELTLGALLNGVLWSLSWYGGPASMTQARELVLERVDDAMTGEMDTCSIDEMFASLGLLPDAEVFAKILENTTPVDLKALQDAIREIDDHALAEPALKLALSVPLQFKPEHATLTGRQLRALVRNLRHQDSLARRR